TPAGVRMCRRTARVRLRTASPAGQAGRVGTSACVGHGSFPDPKRFGSTHRPGGMTAMNGTRTWVLAWLAFGLGRASGAHAGDEAGPLVRALWLVQRHGRPDAVEPRNDQPLKGLLAKAMDKQGVLSAEGVKAVLEPTTVARLAGADGRLDPAEVRAA